MPISRVCRAALALLFAVAGAVPLGGQPCTTFQSGVAFATGAAPYAVALGDVDGDGNLDLVTANWAASNVSVRLGGGDGTFGAESTVSVGTNPTFVLAADLDADGNLDLAVTNQTTNNVSVLLGNGDGTFAAAVHHAVGTGPFGLAAADFDRNGTLDLAVANYTGGTVSILLGNGAGGFAAGTPLTAGGAVFPAVGDFNRDGKPDLAVARYGTSTVAIFLGAGNGTFAAGADLVAQSSPRAIAAADFDRDGDVDLAVANQGSNSVSLFKGNAGNGTFDNAVNFTVGTSPRAIVTADITGDGRLDLAVANRDSDNVSVLIGLTNDSFQTALAFAAGDGPRGVAAGLVDSDRLPDLVVANELGNSVTRLSNSSTCTIDCGTYGWIAAAASAGNGPWHAATADFNRDGKLDLAVPNWSSGSVAVLLGQGNASFSASQVLSTAIAPIAVAAADFDRDGDPDLAVSHDNASTVSVFLGAGDGTFSAAASPTIGSYGRELVAADFNRDGKMDIAALETGTSSVAILLGNGNGTFAAAASHEVTFNYPQSITQGDFNADGAIDLAFADGNDNTVSVILGNGDGTFAPWVSYAVGGFASDVAVGDVNQDGIADLIVARQTNAISVLHGTGTGTFSAAIHSTIGGNASDIVVLEGESSPTIVAAMGAANAAFRMSFNPATSIVSSSRSYATGSLPIALVTADFNRDGRADVAVSNRSTTTLTLLLNYCETQTSLTATPNPSVQGAVVTFEATVAGAVPPLGPTGAISFREGNVLLGTASLDATYKATFQTSALTGGPHTITAFFHGNSFFSSSSTAISVTVVGPPSGVYALPNADATQVTVAWNPAPGATGYEVFRSFDNGALVSLGSTASTNMPDANVAAGKTYVYRVKSLLQGAGASPYSSATAATTVVFTDPLLTKGATIVRLVHMTEARAGVNLVRASAGLAPYPFTDAPPTIVKLVHMQELYTALGEAWAVHGMGTPFSGLNPDLVIRAIDLSEIRSFIRSAPYGGPAE